MAGLEAMIAQAEKSLGLAGRPNYITKWYAKRNGAYFANAAWCQMAISYWAFHSGNHKSVCFDKDWAYTVYLAQEFQKRGQWYTDTAGIRRGDIVYFDWSGTNNVAAIDHVGIVTAVNGRDVIVLEANTSDSCKRRVRQANTIVGYGRPAYATATPTPTPKPEPKPVPYTPPAFPTGLKPNDASPSAKGLQTALKKAGYLASSVPLSDNYGPKTQEAVKKFHAANPAYGTAQDPAIGPKGWAELHREAYGGSTPAPPAPPKPPADDEPAHDYRRVTYGGKTVNVRTKVMLERAVKLLTDYDWTPVLTQGSYNKGVGASAGTHDGGGVVDIRTDTMSRSGQDKCVQALRKAGFAAWLRLPPTFGTHIHAVAIGDKELSPTAKSQIQQWREDRNGLANRGPDTAPDPYPSWTNKYR